MAPNEGTGQMDEVRDRPGGATTVRGPRLLRLRPWRHDGERGQTLVEFSLVLPVFLLLLFAIADFGRGYYTWLIVTNAAREGARTAAVRADSSTIDTKIYASFCSSYPSHCGLDTSKMTITKTNVQGTRGTETSVTVAYNFQYVTPIGSILRLVSGHSLSNPTITSTASMRLE